MKKIKILFFINDLQIGGAERMLEKIVKYLDRNKFEVVVCSMIKGGVIAENLRKNQIKVYELNIKHLFEFPKAVLNLRKLIKSENPSILHGFMYHSNIIGRFAAIGQKCKVISSIRGKLINNKLEGFLDKVTQFLVDVYTVNSNSLRKYARRNGIKKKKLVVVENGIELSKLKADKSNAIIKKELELKNIPTIATVSNLRKIKDYPTLLKAISLVQRETDVNLLIVGGGTGYENEVKRIKKIIRDLGIKNVKLLGHRSDIPNILSVTDIWISSTLSEGQSNSLLEAMAMKKPIITTNIPENVEVVRDNQEAILVPVKAPRRMADSIISLIKDQIFAKRLADGAYSRVKRNHDIKLIISKIEEMYLGLYGELLK